MDICYQNETLYVTIDELLNGQKMMMFKNRIFRIINDYGIDKIVISFANDFDKKLINDFRREYYQKYHGYLLIK